MANVLNVYDDEEKVLALGCYLFFVKCYSDAVAIANKRKISIVYGMKPEDLVASRGAV